MGYTYFPTKMVTERAASYIHPFFLTQTLERFTLKPVIGDTSPFDYLKKISENPLGLLYTYNIIYILYGLKHLVGS